MSAPQADASCIFETLAINLEYGNIDYVQKILSKNPDIVRNLNSRTFGYEAKKFIAQACKYEDLLSLSGKIIDEIDTRNLSELQQTDLFCEIAKFGCPSAIQLAFESGKFDFNKRQFPSNLSAFNVICLRDHKEYSKYYSKGLTAMSCPRTKPSSQLIEAVIFAIDCGNIAGLEEKPIQKFLTTALNCKFITPLDLCNKSPTPATESSESFIDKGLVDFFAQPKKLAEICHNLCKAGHQDVVRNFLTLDCPISTAASKEGILSSLPPLTETPSPSVREARTFGGAGSARSLF